MRRISMGSIGRSGRSILQSGLNQWPLSSPAFTSVQQQGRVVRSFAAQGINTISIVPYSVPPPSKEYPPLFKGGGSESSEYELC